VAPAQRARDAYAALAYLRTLAYVDGGRVGLMGGSHGGSTTLLAMLPPRGAAAGRPGFAAAVALYPGCATAAGKLIGDSSGEYRSLAPLLILVGEADDWTPAEPCRRLADAAQKAGYPVAIKVYPGAYHSFDSSNPPRYVAARINVNSPTGRGATTGGNPAAWADSIREVLAFFRAPSRPQVIETAYRAFMKAGRPHGGTMSIRNAIVSTAFALLAAGVATGAHAQGKQEGPCARGRQEILAATSSRAGAGSRKCMKSHEARSRPPARPR